MFQTNNIILIVFINLQNRYDKRCKFDYINIKKITYKH